MAGLHLGQGAGVDGTSEDVETPFFCCISRSSMLSGALNCKCLQLQLELLLMCVSLEMRPPQADMVSDG